MDGHIGVACLDFMSDEIDARLFSHAIVTVSWSDPNIKTVKLAGDEFQNGMPQLVVNAKNQGKPDTVIAPLSSAIIKRKDFELPELTAPADIMLTGDHLPSNVQKGSSVTKDGKFTISWEFLNVFVDGNVTRDSNPITSAIYAYPDYGRGSYVQQT
jgi:hypothetical protein